MSRPRLQAKLRTNPQYKTVTTYLEGEKLEHALHAPEGASGGHPWFIVQIPGQADPVRFSIASTPNGKCNTKALLSRLKRKLREHGYPC